MKKLMLVLGVLLLAGYAQAAPVIVTFLGFSGSGWESGYPYYANINAGPTIDVMCDDYVHGGAPGMQWLANVTNLGSGDLSQVRFNNLPGALILYDKAGWILLQTLVTNQNQWTDMTLAEWHLFDSSSPLDQGAQQWLDMAEQEAQKGFQGVDFTQVDILTPINQYDPDPNGPQELLTIVAPSPEPGTLILLGTGMLGLLGRKFFH